MSIVRRLVRQLLGQPPRLPATDPAPRASFLEIVERAVAPETPRTVITRNPWGACGGCVPERFCGVEVDWGTMRPHLIFPFEDCRAERTFPELEIRTDIRTIRVQWAHRYGFHVVYEPPQRAEEIANVPQ